MVYQCQVSNVKVFVSTTEHYIIRICSGQNCGRYSVYITIRKHCVRLTQQTNLHTNYVETWV